MAIYTYDLTWEYTNKTADLAGLNNETIAAFSNKFPPDGTENFTLTYYEKNTFDGLIKKVVYNMSWELSVEEKTTLDSVVSNHVPV